MELSDRVTRHTLAWEIGLTAEPPLLEVFKAILRDQRDELNRRFAAQSHLAGGLDGQAFLLHLGEAVAPIVGAVSDVLPECARSVALELYDLSLELFAANAIGPHARSEEIHRVWVDILPRIPKLMSRDAAVVAGSLSNAAFNVARADGGRIDFWLSRMQVVAEACDGVSKLLDCGKILAWRAGMVQYRSAAIAAAATLPPIMAITGLGLSLDTSTDDLQHVFEHLRRSPWNGPEMIDAHEEPEPQLVRTIGDFRGFGGQFLRPPIVASQNDELFATDGQSTWRLLADCYGSLLHRIGGSDVFPHTRNRASDARVALAQRKFPVLAESVSSASIKNTVAATYGDSHRIVMVALP